MSVLIDFFVNLPFIPTYIWLIFLFAILLLIVTSFYLAKYANVLIKKTKMGAIFVGGVLISLATSLPELFTQIFQSSIGSPATGISDDIGSNAFGVFLMGLSALVLFKYHYLKEIKLKSTILLYISFGLSLLYTIFLFFGQDLIIGVENIYAIGLIPILFWLIFIGTTIYQYFNEKNDFRNSSEDKIVLDQKTKNMKSSIAALLFFIGAVLLLVFSLFLNVISSAMSNAKVYNFGPNTIGGLFIAITTSLPEIVIFTIFLKKKQPTAAFGTIVGSQIFNLSLVFYGDLFYTPSSSIIGQANTNTWLIGLLLSVMMLFLIIQISFAKKFTQNWQYYILPSLITICYITWWIYLIALNS